MFFAVHDPSGGTDLEVSSGSGSVLLKHFPVLGPFSGLTQMTAVGSNLFFTVDDGVHGREIWESDGTAAGTVLVTDIKPGSLSSYPGGLAAVGSELYFTASDKTNDPSLQSELWKSDGTAAGTTKIATIQGVLSDPTAFEGKLFFSIKYSSGTSTTSALWESDGTPTGTLAVSTFPGTGASATGVKDLTPVGSKLVFVAPDANNNGANALWATDGTGAGTTQLAAVSPLEGTHSIGAATAGLPVVGGEALFLVESSVLVQGVSDNQLALWKSDGTVGGTAQVALVKDYGATALVSLYPIYAPGTGILYFTVPLANSPSLVELWKSDGTASGTAFIQDINSGITGSSGYNYFGEFTSLPGHFATLGRTLYFTNNGGSHGFELWKSDGTAAGTTLFDDLNPGPDSSFPQNLTVAGGTLYFAAHGTPGVNQLWKTDGSSSEATRVVQSCSPGVTLSSAYAPTGLAANGKVFFSATNGVDGIEPWVTDGTAAGTLELAVVNPGSFSSQPGQFTAVGAQVFFSAQDATSVGLWVSDGTAAGTKLVMDFPSASSQSRLSAFTPLGGSFYFVVTSSAGGSNTSDLYRSDGTAAGTTKVKSLMIGSGYSRQNELSPLTVFNGKLYFSANDGVGSGNELWVSDGTPAGTVILRDINPGPASSYPSPPVVFGGKLYFSADDGTHGSELWSSDGTASGTALLKDINPNGTLSSSPSHLTVVGPSLFFTADDGSSSGSGTELWKTDGTAAGTMLVSNLTSTNRHATLSNFAAVNGKLFFAFDDGVHGLEPWVSDGTATGTKLLSDVNPGPTASLRYFEVRATAANGLLFFAADDGRHGTELWRTDGTSAGTVLVSDINPGLNGSNPYPLGLVNGQLLVMADDGTHGNELMTINPSARPSGGPIGDYYGTGVTDLGVFDATTSTLIVVPPAGSTGLKPLIQQFGDPSHRNIPVVGDYYGTGQTDLGIFDATTSTLIVVPPANSTGLKPLIQQFGDPSHTNFPVAGAQQAAGVVTKGTGGLEVAPGAVDALVIPDGSTMATPTVVSVWSKSVTTNLEAVLSQALDAIRTEMPRG